MTGLSFLKKACTDVDGEETGINIHSGSSPAAKSAGAAQSAGAAAAASPAAQQAPSESVIEPPAKKPKTTPPADLKATRLNAKNDVMAKVKSEETKLETEIAASTTALMQSSGTRLPGVFDSLLERTTIALAYFS